ncbi:unnamed protein product [Lymnaea stagnalis]|uniref:Uncharacterized protein n=1 Tax=Lymnaea stagnalis TaxID=6523 RepID=A0AAV2ILP3_LYMST
MESPLNEDVDDVGDRDNEEKIELKHADSDSTNSIPPPPPTMGMVVPVASEESCDITEAEKLKQQEDELPLYDQGPEQPLCEPEEGGTKPAKLEDGRSENCCESLLKCLGLVPCPSLLSWIILLLGLGCLTGSLLIGTWRTRDLLKNDNELLWFMEYTIIGVVIGMFVVGTLLLAAGHLSTEPTSRRLFNSFTKNRCAQGLNICALVLTYILTLAWILITVLLATPLVLLINIYIVNPTEIHPQHYGFNSSNIPNSKFKEDGDNLLITYGVAFIGSLLVVNSMICFIICITANITHLRDNRFATLNAYGSEEVRNSKHSVVDTNM